MQEIPTDRQKTFSIFTRTNTSTPNPTRTTQANPPKRYR